MRATRGSLLVEILVVVLIISVLAAVYLGLIRRSGVTGPSTPKAAIDKARGIECRNNLNQLRMLVQMGISESGQPPAQLDPSTGIGACPISGQPYSYDPQTGRVWCTTPGHESF